jgi:hypothetical protein
MVLIKASKDAPTIVGYVSAIVLLVALFYVDRRVFDTAASAVASHPVATPSRKWSKVRDERLKKASWWRLVWGGPFFALIAWATFPSASVSGWIWTIWVAYFGVCFGFWTLNVLRKLQIQRMD